MNVVGDYFMIFVPVFALGWFCCWFTGRLREAWRDGQQVIADAERPPNPYAAIFTTIDGTPVSPHEQEAMEKLLRRVERETGK